MLHLLLCVQDFRSMNARSSRVCVNEPEAVLYENDYH